jgi:hypothetical protein
MAIRKKKLSSFAIPEPLNNMLHSDTTAGDVAMTSWNAAKLGFH